MDEPATKTITMDKKTALEICRISSRDGRLRIESNTTTMEILSALGNGFSVASVRERETMNELKQSIIDQLKAQALIDLVDVENPTGDTILNLIGDGGLW